MKLIYFSLFDPCQHIQDFTENRILKSVFFICQGKGKVSDGILVKKF